MVLAGTAAGVMIIVGIGLIVFAGARGDRPDDVLPASGDGETAAGDEAGPDAGTDSGPLDLPLDLQAVGFEGGRIEVMGDDEGPGAVGHCGNQPEAAGLVEWRGNRLTEQDGHQRVAQMLGRFETSLAAATFIVESSEIVDCDEWTIPGEDAADDPDLHVTIEERTPPTVYSDDTRLFDLRVDVDGPDLFLRTLLVRSGRDVAQLTVVSANRQDLDRIDELMSEAVAILDF